MKRSLLKLVRVALLAIVLGAPASLGRASGDALNAAVTTVVEEYAPRVVRLRYFGAGDEVLGGAGAPVTGLALGGGWVVTSTYGLETAPAAAICRLADGSQQPARLVARDFSRRVALLATDEAASSTPEVVVGRAPRVGETVVALGRVFTEDSVSVSVGAVSAVGRLGGRAVQTDAMASPANYGGPLVTLDGTLVGVLTPLAPPGMRGVEIYDSGVGFAAATPQLAERLATLADGRDIRPGRLGVAFSTEDPLRAAARIEKVVAGGPAERAGLTAGDILVSLGGVPTPTVWAARGSAAGLDAGDMTAFAARRGEEEFVGEIALEAGDEPLPAPDGTPAPPSLPGPRSKKPGEP